MHIEVAGIHLDFAEGWDLTTMVLQPPVEGSTGVQPTVTVGVDRLPAEMTLGQFVAKQLQTLVKTKTVVAGKPPRTRQAQVRGAEAASRLDLFLAAANGQPVSHSMVFALVGRRLVTLSATCGPEDFGLQPMLEDVLTSVELS